MASSTIEEPGVKAGDLVAPARVGSIDAYRGLVMFLMMAEVLELSHVASAVPGEGFWETLAYHQTHVEWRGASLHDLIQPSFSFLVGAALPFSIASRRARGQTPGRMTLHAAGRALVLVLLGVFLRSVGRSQTNWTFEDTLSQIGLGYVPLFLLGLARPRWRWVAFVLILVGIWGAFALYPLPGPGFDYAAVGVPPDWPHHATGLAAHWNKNSNLAWAFDTWFLNLFPREAPFTHNRGGYATLSFIPTLATMILGLIAGGWLRNPDLCPRGRVGRLMVAGLVGLGLGLAADRLGIVPNVKRIWTPSWVLFSGGWAFLFLAGFSTVIDWAGWRGWAYPLRVIGANSIAAYVMAHLFNDFVTGSFRTHLGPDVFDALGPAYEPLLAGATILAVYWLILWWMYRHRVFVRI